MKIAITADAHLSNEPKHLFRTKALRNVLVRCAQLKVDALIIAGDLFDNNTLNPVIFENILRDLLPVPYQIFILPGNHDAGLTSSLFSDQLPVHVLEQPIFDTNNFDIPVLFVPYSSERHIGGVLSSFRNLLSANKFLIISHGDLPEQLKERNAYESGVYMPLFKRDLLEFKPKQVFLGHIHKGSSNGNVHYPGSPMGLDITETGPRSFLVYDTLTNELKKVKIVTDSVNYIKKITIIPGVDESSQLIDCVNLWEKEWEQQTDPATVIVLRISINGYSINRGSVESTLRNLFSLCRNPIHVELIDTINLSAFSEVTLLEAARELKQDVDLIPLVDSETLPDKDQIYFEVLRLLFGSEP